MFRDTGAGQPAKPGVSLDLAIDTGQHVLLRLLLVHLCSNVEDPCLPKTYKKHGQVHSINQCSGTSMQACLRA